MFDKKEYMRKYRKQNKEHIKASDNAWRASHPAKVKEYNHRQYLRRKALKNGSGGVSGGDANKGGDSA